MLCSLLLLATAERLQGLSLAQRARVQRLSARMETRQEVARHGARGAEQLEAYADGGLAYPLGSPMVITPGAWKQTMGDLLGAVGSRWALQDNAKGVADKMSELLNRGSRGSAFLQGGTEKAAEEVPFSIGEHKAWNVVRTIPGSGDGQVVIGAHYDSLPANEAFAPGAEDNGSGVTSLLSIHSAMEKLPQPKSTVKFVLFDGEEEGLLGSAAFVKDLFQQDGFDPKKFKGAFIMDEVSYSKDHSAPKKVIFETKGDGEATNRLIDTLASASKQIDGLRSPSLLEQGAVVGLSSPEISINKAGFGSDHIPFLTEGLPAVLTIERDNMEFADAYGHSKKDTVDKTWPDLGATVATIVGNAAYATAVA